MADDPIEDRVTALEKDNVEVHEHLRRHDERLAVHDERITTHGQENDKLREEMIREQMEAKHRDAIMQRTESKLDTLGGKVDSILMQPADKWNGLTKTIVAAVGTGIVAFLLARIGMGV